MNIFKPFLKLVTYDSGGGQSGNNVTGGDEHCPFVTGNKTYPIVAITLPALAHPNMVIIDKHGKIINEILRGLTDLYL